MGTYIRCEPFEVATGWTYGLLPDVPMPPEVVAPRQAFQAITAIAACIRITSVTQPSQPACDQIALGSTPPMLPPR